MVNLLMIAVLAAAPEEPGSSHGRNNVVRDCGARSLFLLARLEGRSASMDDVIKSLPGDRNGHFSLEELRLAGSKLGLNLFAVRLASGREAVDRPAIVYLKRGEHGHFVVIQPVGHTGKLLQVIDPNVEPFILDAEKYHASQEWTGLALVPSRTNWRGRALLIGVAVVLSSLFGAVVSRYRLRRTMTSLLSRGGD